MARRIEVAVVPLLVALAGCSGIADPADETVGVSFAPIIGGTAAATYPEAALLDVDPSSGSSIPCSAAVIAPRVVLTAGHCVDQHTSWQVVNGTQVRTSNRAATYDWHEDAGAGTTVDPNHHDVGLVFLSSDIVLSSYPAIATGPVGSPMQLVNVGRVLNGTATNNLYEATGPIISGVSWGYPYDYAANDLIELPGDCGGPDFVTGSHTIAAVSSGETGGIEVLARVDLVATWIAAQIAAHPGTTPPDAGAADTGSEASADAGSRDAAVDAPVADAGAATVDAPGSYAPAIDASLLTVFPTEEQEPNDTLATATYLGGAMMSGSLQPGSDVDWFRLTVPVGTSAVVLHATGDAVLSSGVIAGAACPSSVVAASSTTVSATGVPMPICVMVYSPLLQAQTYTLVVAH